MPRRMAGAISWLVMALAAVGAERPDVETTGTSGTRWFTSFSSGYAHQLETAAGDVGGEFEVNRFTSRAAVGYMPDYSKSISLSVGYDRDAYGFSGSSGFSGLNPWDDINTFRIGAPVRWGFNKNWTLFAIPTARWTAEDGADWAQSFSAGGFVGVSYRLSDKLTIGPGFGALTQLEDSPSYFPVIIVDWDISENWKLETGRGLGASQGPGLLLSYSVSKSWSLSAGGRYDRFRFRLSQNGSIPNGVGQDKAVPVYLGARYGWGRKGSVMVFGGVDLGGKLQLDDANGRESASSDYDPAPFFGVTANLRF